MVLNFLTIVRRNKILYRMGVVGLFVKNEMNKGVGTDIFSGVSME